jgi:transposase
MNTETKVIKTKLGLLNLAEQLGNVSQACKIFGYSRDSFYRYKELYDQGGEMALADLSRKRPNRKNRIEPVIEERVVSFAIEYPAYGQQRASNELKKEGVFISPCGVRCVWLRHDLETFKKRLKALETKAAQEGLVLTEAQVVAMEKAKEEKKACLFHLKSIPGFQFKSIPLLFRKQYLKKKGVPLSSSGLLAL